MANTITLGTVKVGSEDSCLWFGRPEQLADQLFPDSPTHKGPHDHDLLPLSDGDLAAQQMYEDLIYIEEGKLFIPEWLASDQLEDWVAARAVKRALLEREAR